MRVKFNPGCLAPKPMVQVVRNGVGSYIEQEVYKDCMLQEQIITIIGSTIRTTFKGEIKGL